MGNETPTYPGAADPGSFPPLTLHTPLCYNFFGAGVAQWQSSGIVIRRLSVQVGSPAPELPKYEALCEPPVAESLQSQWRPLPPSSIPGTTWCSHQFNLCYRGADRETLLTSPVCSTHPLVPRLPGPGAFLTPGIPPLPPGVPEQSSSGSRRLM